MLSTLSLRGQVRAASLLVVTLLALVAHTCAPLSLAHSHASASAVAHQGAPDHAAAMHGSCCEAMLLSTPARSTDAIDLADVLPADAAAADSMAPFFEAVATAPGLLSHRRPPLFLLHAPLRI
jgi:hypothetical protein